MTYGLEVWTLAGMSSKQRTGKRINVRRAEIMEMVEKEIQHHYNSEFINKIRENNSTLRTRSCSFYLAKEFGFCNGVRRAIDIAYATKKVFPSSRLFLIGEIIHNPEVNRQLQQLGVIRLPWNEVNEHYEQLGEGDVVIIPAFGVPTEFMDVLDQKGVYIVDTTCGDVMKVWRRVRNYASQGITSIIHGKSSHEETRATASRAMGDDGKGKYLIVYSDADAQVLADFINGKLSCEEIYERFSSSMSEGLNPDEDLIRIGMANQTTMLKDETGKIQNILLEAVINRDGNSEHFSAYGTICGATQDRQNALFELLKEPLDVMFVVGGYNSSNTTHLYEIAQSRIPSYFIERAECIESLDRIRSFSLHDRKEVSLQPVSEFSDLGRVANIGITAGASCPANLIEETIQRIISLREGS